MDDNVTQFMIIMTHPPFVIGNTVRELLKGFMIFFLIFKDKAPRVTLELHKDAWEHLQLVTVSDNWVK